MGTKRPMRDELAICGPCNLASGGILIFAENEMNLPKFEDKLDEPYLNTNLSLDQ